MPCLPNSEAILNNNSVKKGDGSQLNNSGTIRGDSSNRQKKSKRPFDKTDQIDSKQQPSPKASKVTDLVRNNVISEPPDSICGKFDQMLRTNLSVLDQLISRDLFARMEKDKSILIQKSE